jgi:hypothetical protein
MSQVKTPSRGGCRVQPLEVLQSRGSAGVQLIQHCADADAVDPVELPGHVQCREHADPGDEVAGQQDRRGARLLGARHDLRRDVDQATGDAEVRRSALLCIVQSVQVVVPQRGDHRRVAVIGREAEIAAPHDGDGGRDAEFVGHPLRAADVAARDRQRQRRVPSTQDRGCPRPRLARTTQDQYRLHSALLI